VNAGIPSDAKEREAALDVRRSFIVQAPAGSGKTELLVRRFLKLLSLVEKPEEILAITFTKKAAAEMRRRVLEKLPDPAGIAHRLRIQTIDALCAALTRQMPVLARFGGQPEIVEDASDLYLEAATRVLADFNPATEKLLRHLDNDTGRATALVAGMLRSRDRWLRKTGAAPTRAELEAALLSERARLLARARSLYPQASEDLAKELLTREFTWRKKHPLAQSLSQDRELGEPLREALEALCKLPPAKYSEAQWEALEAILALLFPAVSHLKLLFSESGQADFTEFAHGALRALGSVDDPSDLLLSLDGKISHILVDEFQDTSLSQFELIAKLTAGWTGADEVGSAGRTLFVVGDPMQSIYRFREAEVSLFLNAKNSGIGSVGLEPLTLSTNFRSQAGLVAWFNDAFPRVLPAEEDETSGAVPYSPATAHHPALPGPAVSWHCFYDRDAEASEVVKILKEAKGKSAILVRNRAHLDCIVPALKQAGIRWKAIQIEQLGEKQVVQDLYAVTRVLSHPGDRVAALAVLRAPWCGLSLADLLLLCSPPDKGGASEASGGFLVSDLMRDTSHLSPDGQARIARVRDVLGPALADRLRGSLRDRVEGAWLALGGPACLSSQGGDATALEDAEIFLDELERLEAAGEVDLETLAYRIGRLYALPDVEAPEDAVEIMTIHRAKGLEFDTVIVPGLDRLPRAGPKPLFAWKTIFHPPVKGGSEPQASGGLLLAPINETGTDKEPAYNYVRELDKQAEDIEAGRLFYVAATRAQSRLHLLACARVENAETGPTAKEPAKRSLLAKIWWQAREHFGPAPAALEEPPRAPLPDLLRRLPADIVFPLPPASVRWTAPAEGREESEIEFSWAGETARHAGTVVHRWLQRIAEDELRGWDEKRVDALKPRFANELRRRGVQAAEIQRSSEVVAAALKNTLADERGRWILSAHPEARSEYRLRVRTDAGSRSYVMDRVFRAEGRLWIVDYKTSRHEGAGVEGFLDRERDRYATQLQAYGDLLKESQQGLYFPLHRGWRVREP
jgi:ATP-dependent helicase/nuclease subunit A